MPKPMYQTIRDELKNAINTKLYLPGSKIPTEAQLMVDFKVSRMTVNKALRDLVLEGILSRKPGLGTFVCEQKAESPLTEIRNIALEVSLRGNKHSCKVIELSKIYAIDSLALQLAIPSGSLVYRSVLVHYENKLTIQIEDRFVVAQYLPDYLEQDFTQLTPNQYLTEKFPISNIEHTVEAVMPNKKIRKLLDISAKAPCLQVQRRTWSDGKLISFAILTHPGSRYKLCSSLTIKG